MSAQKIKNGRLDFDKREQNKSVVQRFITEKAPTAQEQNNIEDNAITIPQKEQTDISENMANTMKESVNLAPAEPSAPTETAKVELNTQAIAAQLEKLESRLEKLDKLDKLDGLSTLEQKLDANLERKPEQEPPPQYILSNAMEEAVREEVRATLNNVNICKCDKCYYDICALVLNNMAPQYATSPEGILMNKAKILLSMNTLTKISGEIFSAIDKVKNKPDHKKI